MRSKFNEENNKDLDQGWAWVVMVACCLSCVLNGTLVYAAGVIHIAILQRYEEDNAYSSLIGSIFTSLLSLIGPFSSMLINIFSCRVTMVIGGILMFTGFSVSFFATSDLNIILLTYGIVAGTGMGFCATPPLVVIGYFFHLKRGFAIAFVVTGAGIGMFIAGPFVQALINKYGLHGAFLVLAAFASNQIVAGALMRPSDLEYKHKKETQTKKDTEMTSSIRKRKTFAVCKRLLHFEILKDKAFLLCTIQFFMWNIPVAILLLHLPNYAVLQGSEKERAAMLITYVGLGSIGGRILTGLSIGHNGIDPILVNIGFSGILGILTLSFPLYSHSYQGQTIYSTVFGVYTGGLITLINPLCMELVGVAKVSSGVGVMYFIGGLGCLIGPPIAGFMVDKGGTYEESFCFSGALFLLASLCTLISSKWRANTDEVKGMVISNDSFSDPQLSNNSLSITNDGKINSEKMHNENDKDSCDIPHEFDNDRSPLACSQQSFGWSCRKTEEENNGSI